MTGATRRIGSQHQGRDAAAVAPAGCRPSSRSGPARRRRPRRAGGRRGRVVEGSQRDSDANEVEQIAVVGQHHRRTSPRRERVRQRACPAELGHLLECGRAGEGDGGLTRKGACAPREVSAVSIWISNIGGRLVRRGRPRRASASTSSVSNRLVRSVARPTLVSTPWLTYAQDGLDLHAEPPRGPPPVARC